MSPRIARFPLLVSLLGSLLAGIGLPAAIGETLEVGSMAPDLTLPSLDGDELTLSERRGEGPMVLVFFRGAW